jgi:hypothetical protein
MIKEIIKPSGQYTYRVWFGDTKDPNIRSSLAQKLRALGCLLEWYSENLLAISCAEKKAQEVADLLNEHEKGSLIKYEFFRNCRDVITKPQQG